MPASSEPRAGRTNGVPAYYLGRPAGWWVIATTRRVQVPDAADQALHAPGTQETR